MTIHTGSKLVEIATKVIIHAGNARNTIVKALNAANDDDFSTASDFIDEAENELRAAHHIQTGIIQAEAKGEIVECSLLLNHAQDTLMAAMTELNLAKQMIRMYLKFNCKS